MDFQQLRVRAITRSHSAGVLPSQRIGGLRRLGLAAVFGIVMSADVWPQTPPNRPALIRDTDKAEGKEEEATKEKTYNPIEAEKSVKIGDFYFKKKNYTAAIQRYVEALEYHPTLSVAYENLGKAYEKSNNYEKALEVYRDYVQKNPSSGKVPEFQSRIARLEKKLPPNK
jgi:tetratricopeptide (TPR) repeat protein